MNAKELRKIIAEAADDAEVLIFEDGISRPRQIISAVDADYTVNVTIGDYVDLDPELDFGEET